MMSVCTELKDSIQRKEAAREQLLAWQEQGGLPESLVDFEGNADALVEVVLLERQTKSEKEEASKPEPESIDEQKEEQNFTDLKDEDIPFSKKGRHSSGKESTAKQVRNELSQRFGKRISRLEKSGRLIIKDKASDDSAGAYADGKVTLYANNIEQGNAFGVFLHEAGEHAGLESMVGAAKYKKIVKQFETLLSKGNEYAQRAVDRVPSDTKAEHVNAERLAYLIEAVQNREGRNGNVNAAKMLVARIVAAVKAWAFDKLPSWATRSMKLTPEDFRALAVRAARSYTDNTATLDSSNNKSAQQMVAKNDDPVSLPDVVIGHALGKLNKHPDYDAAKTGDDEAAVRVAKDLVTDEVVSKINSLLDEGVLITPVLAEEQQGRNKIPLAVAKVLQTETGLDSDIGIFQINKVGRTHLDGLDRIFAVPEFDGDVIQGRSYFLVDDTLTQGGTFASLASHINQMGGSVVGAFALTGKNYSAKLKPDQGTLDKLYDKYGDIEDAFKQATGYGFSALTQSEARYLSNYKPSEHVRDKIFEKGDVAISQGDGSDVGLVGRQRKNSDDEAPPSEGLRRSGDSDIRYSKKAPPSEGLVGSGVSEKEASALFEDEGDYEGKKGLERGKELLGKTWQWVKDNAHEFSKNGGLATVTLRQLVDLTKKSLPSGEAYLLRVEKMLTRRNQMQDEAAKVAIRWNKLNKIVKHRMATVMHSATIAGVDPSDTQFKLGESLVKGGMERARYMAGMSEYQPDFKEDDIRVEATPKNLAVLSQQKRKTKATWKKARNKDTAGLAEQNFLRAVDEWRNMRNAIARDKKRKRSYPKLRRMYLALPKEARDLFIEARDMYVDRSNDTEKALIAQIELLEGLTKEKKKTALSMIRYEFESARLQGIYFPLFRKGDYFVKAQKLRDDLVDGQQTYTKLVKSNNIEMVTDKKTGEQRYRAMNANVSFATYEEAVALSNKWATEEQAMASAQSRADLLGKNLIPVAEGNGFVLKDNPYENVFMMAQTAAEAERLAADLMKEGNIDVRHGKLNKMQTQEDFSVSGSFLSDLMGTLKKGNVSDAMQDEVYQLYLNTLPELSQRKHFIHRKKVEGFSENALQAFSHNMMHQAHQISKLEAREELTQLQANIAEEASKAHQDDAIVAGNARDEFKQRHEWVMNPNNASWTNKTSAFGFFMYLGLSPAAALVNLTQTAIVAYPTLAAKFGWKAAGMAFINASKQLSAKETLLGEDAIDRKHLTKDEIEAMEHWHDTGVIDRSQAHMLAGIGDSDSFQNSPTYQKWMGLTAHLFHKAEMVNRETTLLAAYRLARDSKDFKGDPKQYAADVTWESQFDYSNANRARMMQGDWAKLFLMFKSYSQHMIYYLLRNANQWGKGKDADGGEKAARESKVKLLGILGMTLAMGGVSALPIGLVGGAAAYQYTSAKYGRKAAIYGTGGTLALLALAYALWDDDDEPWDIETELRSTLRGWGGDDLEAFVMRGGLNAATGIDISARISLDDLLIREPNRELEGRDAYIHYLQQAVGPVLAKAGDIGFMAPALWADDHGYRALEKASPKFARDVLKMLRFGNEGALNYRGDAIVEKDLFSMHGNEMNLWNIAWQGMGFTPEKLGRQYTKTNDVKKYEARLKDRRSKLLRKYYMSFIENDRGGMQDVYDEIKVFNRKNPELKPIDDKYIKRSMNQRMRYRKESIHGASISKPFRFLVDKLNME